jgi:hypothetical protein
MCTHDLGFDAQREGLEKVGNVGRRSKILNLPELRPQSELDNAASLSTKSSWLGNAIHWFRWAGSTTSS